MVTDMRLLHIITHVTCAKYRYRIEIEILILNHHYDKLRRILIQCKHKQMLWIRGSLLMVI